MRILLKAKNHAGRDRNYFFSLDSAKLPDIYLKDLPLSAKVERDLIKVAQLGKKEFKLSKALIC